VRVQIDSAAALADEAEGLRPEAQTVEIAYDLVRGASAVQIAVGKESGTLSRRPDPALIKGVVHGYQWRGQLLSGEAGSVAELASQAGVNARYVVRTVRMGFLAPDIIETILEGRQTAALTFEIFRHRFLWTGPRNASCWGLSNEIRQEVVIRDNGLLWD
jgi:hypothetical protein